MRNIYIDVISKNTGEKKRANIDELIACMLNDLNIFGYSKEVIKVLVVLLRSSLMKRVKNSGYEVQNFEDLYMCELSDLLPQNKDIAFEAEKETEGTIAVCGKKAVDMYFTNCCGGGTANSEDVLGRHISYIRKVICKYCSEKFYEKEVILEETANKKINYKNEIRGIISDVERDSTGRIINLSFLNKKMTGEEFIKLLNLKSNRVFFKESRACLKSVGDGLGLGICLEGAEKMAQEGRNYKEIINYYYTGVTFKELSEEDILNKLNHEKIVIDPGHGGEDFGNLHDNVCEKDANLSIAEILKGKLEAKGAEVIMTRNGDETVTLSDRTAKINDEMPKFFISIHQNFFEAPGVNGLEAYCYDKDYDANALAEIIANEISNGTGIKNRGVKKRDYYVLREAKVSGIIIECMYISGDDDIKRYNIHSYEKIAQSIYEGICKYYNIRP